MEVDACLLGRPPRFTGSEAEWSDGSFQARAHFNTVNRSMADHLDAVERNSERGVIRSSFGDVALRTDDVAAGTTFASVEGGTGQRFRG